MRLHLSLALAHALLALSATAAPVPKRPPPDPALTADALAGEWQYAWGPHPDGAIILNRDGTYGAVHVHGSQTRYYGTWAVSGTTVTLTERGFDLETGRTWAGGTYVFEFGATRPPALSGLSNRDSPVKLTRPQR